MTTYSKIILTKTATVAAEPVADNLDHGELAINYSDGKLYYKDVGNVINLIASRQSIELLEDHRTDKTNPHEVTKADVGLDNVDNTSDISKIVSSKAQNQLNLKADKASTYTKSEVDGLVLNQVELSSFSVGLPKAASGNGAVSYESSTGTFTYTPPNITLSSLGGIGYANLSVSTVSASGNGAVSYESSTGTFTYTPPVIPSITGSISVDDLTLTGRSDVTQSTSIETGVEIDAIAGTITCFAFDSTAHVAKTFTVTNGKVSANDVIILSRKSLDFKEVMCHVTAVADGSFDITHYCGTDLVAVDSVINFAIIKTAV